MTTPSLTDRGLMPRISWAVTPDPDLVFSEVWNVSGSPEVFADEVEDWTPIGHARGVILPGPDPLEADNFHFVEPLDARDAATYLAADLLLSNLDKITVGGYPLEGTERFLLLEWLECDKEHRGKAFTAAVMRSLLAAPLDWLVIMLLARGEHLAKHWERHGFTVISVSHEDDGVPVSLLVADRYTLEGHPSNLAQDIDT